MKKFFTKSAPMAALISLMVGCADSDELMIGSSTEAEVQTLLCTIDSDDSKIAFTDLGSSGVKLAWELGDTVTVYNKSTGLRIGDFVATSIDSGSSVVKFSSTPQTGTLESGVQYRIFYPQTDVATRTEREAEKFTLIQDGNDGIDHLDAGCKMSTQFNYSEDMGNIRFYHDMALFTVSFKLPEGEEVEKFVITDGSNRYLSYLTNIDNSETINARILVDANSGSRNLMFEASTATDIYTYEHSTELTYSGGDNYKVTLPAYGEGLELNRLKFTPIAATPQGTLTIKDVDFTSESFNTIEIRNSAVDLNNKKVVRVYKNSLEGELIGEITLASTNATDNYGVVYAKLDKVLDEVVDLCFEFDYSEDDECDIDYIDFNYRDYDNQKSLVDFFLPMEPQGELISTGIWGDAAVLPRDINNGIEDASSGKWCYWDGGIVKGSDNKYHLYCSRWGQENSHSTGWQEASQGVYAVSDNIMGPYEDKGLVYPDTLDGKGHNVYGFKLHDGRFGVVSSEITHGEIYVAENPEGPFTNLGQIEVDLNGYDSGLAYYNTGDQNMSNVQIRQCPEGQGYILIGRSTAPMISEDDVIGPYKIMGDRVYLNNINLPQSYNEDPTIWHSGGLYHIVYNNWPSDTSHHFTSKTGYSDWVYRGVAFSKEGLEIFKYSDGTINNWAVVQRPTAYVDEESGHVTHFIFSVIDVLKGSDGANDNHASKIVVVPFDGEAFDNYFDNL